MRSCLALLALVAGPIALAPSPAHADPASSPAAAPSALERLQAAEQESQNLQRAVNLARNTAVQLNGGLGLYQPEPCMVEARRVTACLVSRGPDGFVFRFRGGVPGWVAEGKPASVETEVAIAVDGRSLIKTLYNGVPRSTTTSAPAQGTCPCSCPRAGAKTAS